MFNGNDDLMNWAFKLERQKIEQNTKRAMFENEKRLKEKEIKAVKEKYSGIGYMNKSVIDLCRNATDQAHLNLCQIGEKPEKFKMEYSVLQNELSSHLKAIDIHATKIKSCTTLLEADKCASELDDFHRKAFSLIEMKIRHLQNDVFSYVHQEKNEKVPNININELNNEERDLNNDYLKTKIVDLEKKNKELENIILEILNAENQNITNKNENENVELENLIQKKYKKILKLKEKNTNYKQIKKKFEILNAENQNLKNQNELLEQKINFLNEKCEFLKINQKDDLENQTFSIIEKSIFKANEEKNQLDSLDALSEI